MDSPEFCIRSVAAQLLNFAEMLFFLSMRKVLSKSQFPWKFQAGTIDVPKLPLSDHVKLTNLNFEAISVKFKTSYQTPSQTATFESRRDNVGLRPDLSDITTR
jgi:hypothetical protein